MQGSAAAFDSDSDEDGLLHIGGVVVRVDAAGTGRASLVAPPSAGAQNRRQQRRRGGGRGGGGGGSPGGEGREEMQESDPAVRDYLANIAAAEAAEAAAAAEGEESGEGAEVASGTSGSQADTEGDRRSRAGSAAKRRRQQVGLGLGYQQGAALRSTIACVCGACMRRRDIPAGGVRHLT